MKNALSGPSNSGSSVLTNMLKPELKPYPELFLENS